MPDRYVRKQTLANSERYMTPELKEIEQKVVGAQEQSVRLELQLFSEIREQISAQIRRIQQTALALKTLDALLSLAQTATENHYVRPEMTTDGTLEILDGRHPVVEQTLNDGGFVPNDTQMNGTLLLNKGFFTGMVIVLAFTVGSSIVMWLAERIDFKGIGNGISMVLFASILSQGLSFATGLVNNVQEGNYWFPAIAVVVCLLMLVGIVFVNGAERRLPVQYAKRVVGRKMYGGNQTHLPMKVLMTGVMPIIFANSFCMLPSTIASFLPNTGFATWVNDNFSTSSWLYGILFFLLIIFFNYFYVSVSYDPVEISNNLQKNGGSIPGIRPGEPTVNYIKKSLNKITLFGAVFLGIVALIPTIVSVATGQSFALSGNSLLIVVSIVLETGMVLASQVTMRHYKGFLE